MTTSDSTQPDRFEVFGEQWIKSIFGNSASRPRAILIIWVFSLLPLCSYFVITTIDGSIRLAEGSMGLLNDVQVFLVLGAALPGILSAMAIIFPKFPEVVGSLRRALPAMTEV